MADGSGFEPCDCAGPESGPPSTSSDASADSEAPIAEGGSAEGGASVDVATDGPADSGSWTPKNLSALVLWLNDQGLETVPNDAGGQDVVAWADASGKVNNAVYTSLGGGVPGFGAPKIGTPRAGHAVATMTLATLDVASSSSFQFPGDFAFAIVARCTASKGEQHFMTQQTYWTLDASDGGQMQVTTSYNGGADETTQKGLCDSNFHRFAIRQRQGMPLDFVVDGVITQAKGSLTIPANSTETLGYFDGDLAEVVALSGTVSDADLAAIDQYFTGKFALP